MPYDNTPFDQQMHSDVASRRTAPTAHTVRIGNDLSADASPSAPVNPTTVSTPTPTSSALPQLTKSTPLPVLIGVAMAIGAVCVVGGSLLVRRLVPNTKNQIIASNQRIPAPGNEVMNPDLVIRNPAENSEKPTEEKTASTTPDTAEVVPQETPSVEITDIPDRPSKTSSPYTRSSSEAVSTLPGEIYRSQHYEVTPPEGFTLSQSGRRTIWKHQNGTQILVETGKAGDGDLRGSWVRLERDLKKRYGKRYRSLGIRDGDFAGQPAAIWEFELTGKDGITRRKVDIGIQQNGRGYAFLGSAPKENYDAALPQIRAAMDSFRLNDSTDNAKETDKNNAEGADVKSAKPETESERENGEEQQNENADEDNQNEQPKREKLRKRAPKNRSRDEKNVYPLPTVVPNEETNERGF